MLELNLHAQRGALHLEVNCRFDARWTVLFGPSGAGKTTLLRLVAGLDSPDAGSIRLNGHAVYDLASRIRIRPGRRSIGLAPQRPALFPGLSVAENVAYGIANLVRESRTQRVDSVLTLTGAAELADRYPDSLSGGEIQRVSLAQALAPIPRFVLLDEPLSALDGASRDAVLTRLRVWLAEHSIQAILVTHDAADALATEAEVVLLHEGRVVAQGPAAEVLQAERTRILARLGMLEPAATEEPEIP
jgi:ABC-type sulfate/molybdate transport systems ATPase subunit